jgi:hypothetical protein
MTAMRYALLIVGIVAFVPIALAETIEYKIFELRGDGSRVLIAQDSLKYSVQDIRVSHHRARSGSDSFWDKSLRLKQDFTVSAMIRRKSELEGFGLTVKNLDDPLGFSWEWFNRLEKDIFEKLQGATHVRVTVRGIDGQQELTSIEFLEDTVLRYQQNIFLNKDKVTHEIHVAKDSVLRFAP